MCVWIQANRWTPDGYPCPRYGSPGLPQPQGPRDLEIADRDMRFEGFLKLFVHLHSGGRHDDQVL